MPKQVSMQLTEATERQIHALTDLGFGNRTDIVRLAVDRMYREEREHVNTEKWDHVLIDGEFPGTVVQDSHSRSLVSTDRADGESGEQREWYDNDRLTVTERRTEKAIGNEAELGIKLY